MSILEYLEEFEELETGYGEPVENEESDNKPKLYVKENNFGQNNYFFTAVENEKYKFRLKKDFSNIEELEKLRYWEIDKMIEGYSEYYVYASRDKPAHNTEVDELPPGFYSVGYSNDYGYFLIEQKQSTGDKYLELGGDFKDIRNAIDDFYKKEDVYRDLGMLHKMGALIYGPPGNGKSMLLRELCKGYKKNSVVIFIDDNLPIDLIKKLKYFPSKYIFVLEEMTHILNRSSDLARMLNFLDGEYSLDNQLVLGTTNYPEVLPDNLASRPSRFDKLIEVGNPNAETRRKYLKSLIDISDEEMEETVKATKDMSIAYLKEIVISSKIRGCSIKEAIKESKDRIKKVKEKFATTNTGSMGLRR